MQKITILIPTHNRVEFLKRQCAYLRAMQPEANILIVDSTPGLAWRENQNTVNNISKNLRIQYLRQEKPLLDKLIWSLDQVVTPYVVFCADDDFLNFHCLSKYIEFLVDHVDYSCAGGATVKIRTNKTGKRREVLCRGYSLLSSSAVSRFKHFASYWFSTFYHVQRTEGLRENFRMASCLDFEAARIYPEYLLAQLNISSGMVKFFPELYSIRQMHTSNLGSSPLVLSQSAHRDQHDKFIAILANHLSRACSISAHKSQEIVSTSYYHFARDKLKRQFWHRIVRGPIHCLRFMADLFQKDNIYERHVFGVKHPFRTERSWILGKFLIDNYPSGIDGPTFDSFDIERFSRQP